MIWASRHLLSKFPQKMPQTAIHCNTLQHTATQCNHCNTLHQTLPSPGEAPWGKGHTVQYTPQYCNTLQHTAIHCNTLKHTATHCNTLHRILESQIEAPRKRPHAATHCNRIATHWNTMHHNASHCNTMQYTTIHCNTPFCLLSKAPRKRPMVW